MKKLTDTKMIYLLIAIVLVIALFLLYKKQAGQAKVSEFGRYQGYSEELYAGNKRLSDYLTLSDGTRLACITSVGKKRPCSGYGPKCTPGDTSWARSSEPNISKICSSMATPSSWSKGRGTGASFGVMDASFEVAAKNASEILDWIASQTWCNGNIGMFGDSFQAMIQFATAAAGNPHLKAIFPASSSLDNYSAVIYRAGSKGGRIRITIAFADADNFETPVLNPEPRLRLLRDTDHRSSIQLPVVRPQ